MASSCPDRCSNFLEWDFPENCCPEEERKECEYHGCSDYFEGVNFKLTFHFYQFLSISYFAGGCFEHHAAYPMNDVETTPMKDLDLNTCRQKCFENWNCKVFSWRSTKPSVCRLKSSKIKLKEGKWKNRIGDNIPSKDSVSGERGHCKGCKTIILNHIFQSLCFSA